jgi:hypothetical protein
MDSRSLSTVAEVQSKSEKKMQFKNVFASSSFRGGRLSSWAWALGVVILSAGVTTSTAFAAKKGGPSTSTTGVTVQLAVSSSTDTAQALVSVCSDSTCGGHAKIQSCLSLMATGAGADTESCGGGSNWGGYEYSIYVGNLVCSGVEVLGTEVTCGSAMLLVH